MTWLGQNLQYIAKQLLQNNMCRWLILYIFITLNTQQDAIHKAKFRFSLINGKQ